MYKRATEEGLKAGADRLQFNAKPLENKTLYLCFRDDEQGRSMKRLFNAGLARINELQNFRVTYTSAANALFSARSGAHDDLVLSLAIACWWGARPKATVGMIRLTGHAYARE